MKLSVTGIKALGLSLLLGLTSVSIVGLSACGQVNSRGDSSVNYASDKEGGFTPLKLKGNVDDRSAQSATRLQAAAPGASGIVSQSELLAVQARHGIKEMVTATVQVKRLLPEDRKGVPHQKFLLQLENGTTVLVAHNTEQASPVPLSPGDFVTIHGEYIWNPKGGLIHWTHHSDNFKHEGGWIDFGGRRYE
jgi:hypothetical protein